MTIPVTIIGGYLGAGKTTLINRLLAEREPQGIAVMVNDFGAINIDAELLRESADGRIRSFANGCICCSIGEDFGTALEALRQQPEAIDHVIVEASGVATPANLRRQCHAPGFQARGCLVVVDGTNYARKSGDKYIGSLLDQQIREADWLHLNRTSGDLELPGCGQTRLTEDELVGLAWPAAAAPARHAAPATVSFVSVSARQLGTIDKRGLIQRLQQLPDWVERVKGFVATADQVLLVQQTAGRFEIIPIESDAEPALVFIAPAAHAATLRVHLERVWPAWRSDTP